MRKLYKQLQLQSINIEIEDKIDAKDISRVKLRFYEDGDQSKLHFTKDYAENHNNMLKWNQNFELRYTGQKKITFETFCEHEFGYKKNELKVLYEGDYYIKNEMFFKNDHCHIYNKNGQKCGILRFFIKVITKEEEQIIEEVVQKIVPLVREDLIGQMKINQVNLQITNPIFSKKKYNDYLDLIVKFDGEVKIFENCGDFKWNCKGLKLQYVLEGEPTISFQIMYQHKIILEGTAHCENLEKDKRYIQFKVIMFNKNGFKIGNLILDFRYVLRQQLLDLLYSPNSKLSHTEKDSSAMSTTRLIHKQFESTPQIKTFDKVKVGKKRSKKHVSFFNKSEEKILTKNRQQIFSNNSKHTYMMTKNSQIFMPKAARFLQNKSNSPYVSYIDPQKSSQFSPNQKNKGYDMSRSSKMDFTRQYKNNPGVGRYKLPSIWQKY